MIIDVITYYLTKKECIAIKSFIKEKKLKIGSILNKEDMNYVVVGISNNRDNTSLYCLCTKNQQITKEWGNIKNTSFGLFSR